MTEKEILEKTVAFLEELGKKASNMMPGDQRKYLARYSIGSMESLRRFWKYKKKQLDDIKGGQCGRFGPKKKKSS